MREKAPSTGPLAPIGHFPGPESRLRPSKQPRVEKPLQPHPGPATRLEQQGSAGVARWPAPKGPGVFRWREGTKERGPGHARATHLKEGKHRCREPRFRGRPSASQDWLLLRGGASPPLSRLPDCIPQPMRTEEDPNSRHQWGIARERVAFLFFFLIFFPLSRRIQVYDPAAPCVQAQEVLLLYFSRIPLRLPG